MQSNDVINSARKLIYLPKDAEYVAKGFCKYYTDNEPELSLERKIAKYLKKFDSQLRCTIPYDVLYILLYDTTLLPTDRNINRDMSDARRELLAIENACLMTFRNIYTDAKYDVVSYLEEKMFLQREIQEILEEFKLQMKPVTSDDEEILKEFELQMKPVTSDDEEMVEDIHNGISKKLELKEKKLELKEIDTRRNMISKNIDIPLRKYWNTYFLNNPNLKNLYEFYPIEDALNDILNHKRILDTVLPNPSYTNYLEKSVENRILEEGHVQGQINPCNEEETAQELLEHSDSSNAPTYEEPNDEDINSEKKITETVMKAIENYLIQNISESKSLNTTEFRIPSVLATLVRRIVQGGNQIERFTIETTEKSTETTGKSTQLDWSYIISSPKENIEKPKASKLTKVQRLESFAMKILLEESTLKDIIRTITSSSTIKNRPIIQKLLNETDNLSTEQIIKTVKTVMPHYGNELVKRINLIENPDEHQTVSLQSGENNRNE